MPKKLSTTLDELMTYNEAAEELNITRQTVWEWARKGILAPIKAGYAVFFRRSDIEALKRQRTNGDSSE